jgi:hypothetical protein
MRIRSISAAVLFLAAAVATPVAVAVPLDIPATHPRLWYGNAGRLQQARDYFAAHPFTPGATDYAGRALRGLLVNNAADCTAAAHHFRDYIASAGPGGFRDDIRQDGEDLLLMFDWCHASLTAGEIGTLVTRWNGYMDRELADDLGNAGKEANNYWAGRTRNLLLWGIASFGENPRAQEFIDEALDERMGVQFPDWYAKHGRGGVFPEGGDYGIVSLSYPVLAFASAADFGHDAFAQTPYFKEALYALIYGTTPGPSSITGTAQNLHSFFPFNDDEHFHEGGAINTRDYLGDFATYYGTRAPTTGNARHINGWVSRTSAGRRWMFDALGTTGNPADLSTMPLDYYAPGAAYFDMRSSHDPVNAMQVHLQLGTPGGIEHRHLDAGSFQVWRKGRWLTRESAGYSDVLAGFGGTGTMDTLEPAAHNALLFEGRTTGIWIGDSGPNPVPPGTPPSDLPRDLPQVRRLQHAPDFGYVAADYAGSYRNGLDTRVDWPYAEAAWREFLFIRPLQALVILDRTRGSSDSLRPFYGTMNWLLGGPRIAGAQVRRTYVHHFETQPAAIGTSRLSAMVGTQRSELITLIPNAPYGAPNANVRIFNEDQPNDEEAGQYRLELDTVGTQDAYFLNVVTGYDTGEATLTATLQDLGDRWQVSLSHPVRGSAIVTLMKGMSSTGGSVQIGTGAVTPLNSGVQGIRVTDDGPVWDTGLFSDGFE